VFGQQRHSGEGLAAGLTRVALDVRVRLQMSPQVGPVRKGARAVRAAERLLPRVGPDVTLQEPRPREGLSAEHTLARQRVRSDVHLQGPQADVDLVAVLAAERLFDLLLDAVQFLVFGQSAVGRVGLVAVGALVTRRCHVTGHVAALLSGFADADDGRVGRQRPAATGRGGRQVFDVAAVGELMGPRRFRVVARRWRRFARRERRQLLMSVHRSVRLVRKGQVGRLVRRLVVVVVVVVVTDGDVAGRNAGHVQVERFQRTG